MDGKQNSSQGSPPGTSLEAPHSAPSPELSLESHPSRSQIRATDKVLTESPRCCCQQPALPPCLRASGAPSPAPAPAFAPHIRKDVKPSISHFWGHHSQSGGIFWGQTPKGTCSSLIQKSEFNILHKNYQTATTNTHTHTQKPPHLLARVATDMTTKENGQMSLLECILVRLNGPNVNLVSLEWK